MAVANLQFSLHVLAPMLFLVVALGDFVPSTLFPDFKGGGTYLADTPGETEIEFHYLHNNERGSHDVEAGKILEP